jgi:uncharacterized membrane protein YeaQ/YmgE (transglycosylase-associated protein family)
MLYELTYACLGAVVGVIARLLLPGRHPRGTVLIPLLAVAGGWVAGRIGEKLRLYRARTTAGLVMSTLGAIATVLVYGLAVYEL